MDLNIPNINNIIHDLRYNLNSVNSHFQGNTLKTH
jgi:hypothetical protein